MNGDLRAYAKQTTFRLIVAGILLLFIVGDGLIYLIFGAGAAIGGLLCLAGGLVPVGLIWVVFWIMDWIKRRADRE
jgi:hypothetical protein